MPDIFHSFPIKAPLQKVFDGISLPKEIDNWWSKGCKGKPTLNETYQFHFGIPYDWEAVVSKYVPNTELEFTMTDSDFDWDGTRVGFVLDHREGVTNVQFYHTGWKEANEHYKISSFCWAMYLRLLKCYLEFGEMVPYEDRLSV